MAGRIDRGGALEVTCRELPDYRVSTLPTAASWPHGVTPYQWLVLFVAWFGWVFDSMDATIYALFIFRGGKVSRYREFYDETAARASIG